MNAKTIYKTCWDGVEDVTSQISNLYDIRHLRTGIIFQAKGSYGKCADRFTTKEFICKNVVNDVYGEIREALIKAIPTLLSHDILINSYTKKKTLLDELLGLVSV